MDTDMQYLNQREGITIKRVEWLYGVSVLHCVVIGYLYSYFTRCHHDVNSNDIGNSKGQYGRIIKERGSLECLRRNVLIGIFERFLKYYELDGNTNLFVISICAEISIFIENPLTKEKKFHGFHYLGTIADKQEVHSVEQPRTHQYLKIIKLRIRIYVNVQTIPGGNQTERASLGTVQIETLKVANKRKKYLAPDTKTIKMYYYGLAAETGGDNEDDDLTSIEDKSATCSNILSDIFCLFLMEDSTYPSTTLDDFHPPCLLRTSIVPPESANKDVDKSVIKIIHILKVFNSKLGREAKTSIYQGKYWKRHKVLFHNFPPKKSSRQYECAYNKFKGLCGLKKIQKVVLLAYFEHNINNINPSTLWSVHSMLKSTLNAKENENIRKFTILIP
ncbi:hypothetical protein NQ317_016472 [Molorchus minor]|uniref:Uncharacterized protein n=1 Tax=Molorchus minor TaxID=1323400 RepID=A0ABQ9JP27_9CUCU|nr:hypothetical protein NQ317_016472 [Molorchus minor]